MLRTRVLTAVVLLLLLLGAAAWSHWALLALAAAFTGVALAECLRLSGVPPTAAGAVGAAGAVLAFALEALALRPPSAVLALLCAAACGLWLANVALLWRAQSEGLVLGRPALVAGALVLAAAAWLALADLLRQGLTVTLSVLALVWLADIAAYFCGRAFGSRKLASRISPGKTWEGVWGALAFVVLGSELLHWRWPELDAWSNQVLAAAPVSGVAIILAFVALSIAGDLFESLVKRQAGVKDSGRILPGHGGVWDRIDATVPVLPLAVLSQWLLTGGRAHG